MNTQLRRAVVGALNAPAVPVAFAFATLAALHLGSPFPVALWGAAVAFWVALVATDEGYVRRMLRDERVQARRDQAREREQRLAAMAERLRRGPFAAPLSHGLLPDYVGRLGQLGRDCAGVEAAVKARPELELSYAVELGQQLDQLVDQYLTLIDRRLAGLESLGGLPAPGQPLRRVAEVEQQLHDLRRRAAREPALAAAHRARLDVLSRRWDQLQLQLQRDAQLAVQLDTFPDVVALSLAKLREPDATGADVGALLRDFMESLEAPLEAVPVLTVVEAPEADAGQRPRARTAG
jgi:hypothetical protein